jgi:HNH endonuclease
VRAEIPSTSPVTKHSKAYWRDRVFHPTVDGKEVSNYAVRMCCGNRPRSLSLRTPDREKAAQIARDWYVYLIAHGWDAFDAKYCNANTSTAPGGVNYERCRKRLVLLREELDQRPNIDRLGKRFWEIVRGIGCTNCGFSKWPTILEFHHIDRDRGNNSLENLTVLCPNCHSAHHKKVAQIEIKSLAQLMIEHGLTTPQAHD